MNRIALVGMPGSGKSSVGRHMANRLGWPFIDADHEIERRTGTSIANIFELEGEAGFRQREERLIDELTQTSPFVLATGGGAVLRASTRERLHQRTTVVYLAAALDELVVRLRHDRHRPLLQGVDHRTKLRELFELRDPLYREVAHVVIETGRPHSAALAALVISQLELAGLIGAH